MTTKSIRQIGVTDIPRLWRFRRDRVALAIPDAVYHSHIDDLMAALPVGRRFARAFVAESEAAIKAMIELHPERDEYRWVVTALGARVLGGDEVEDEVIRVWAELLGYSARVAGHSGAKRVHATVPVDTVAQRAMIRAGFSIYGHQTVLLAHELHAPDVEEPPVREREPSDAWSIHHLYHLTTPRPVQYAEALTSNHWDARRALNAETRGFVMECDGTLVGYCQVMHRKDCYALEVIMAQDKLDLVPSLIGQSIRLADVGKDDQVWISVPDYHLEFIPALEEMGFEEQTRQALMVRYTMVPVNGYQSRWVHAVSDVIERLPARTPVVTRWERDSA